MEIKTPGLIVAPLTPFTADLKVDETAMKRQIDYVVEGGATMVVAAGVETQEYMYLSFEERRALIRAHHRTRRQARAGDGRHLASLVQDRDLARARCGTLRRGGGAAAGAAAPVRRAADRSRPRRLFRSGVEGDPPSRHALPQSGPGADVSIPTTIALAQLPRVALIKESSRDLARVSRLIVEIDHAGHARYFTTMQMLLATLELGGSGATMPPPASEIARQVIDAFVAKDHERAAPLQLQFALFPAKWMHRGLAPVMKTAMKMIGVPVGEPYPPYVALSRDERAAMAALLKTTALGHRLTATAAA